LALSVAAKASSPTSSTQRRTVELAEDVQVHWSDDWIFASRLHKGRSPYWGACILRKFIRPVAESLKIQKRIGWHTFRHTYSTLLRSVGAEFKVMQELMRHSTLRTTMDVYTQAVAPAKRGGAKKGIKMWLFAPSNI
jgi:site-specific recombinase XerD